MDEAKAYMDRAAMGTQGYAAGQYSPGLGVGVAGGMARGLTPERDISNVGVALDRQSECVQALGQAVDYLSRKLELALGPERPRPVDNAKVPQSIGADSTLVRKLNETNSHLSAIREMVERLAERVEL